MKYHLGCGTIRLSGFMNVDLMKSAATDLVADIRGLQFLRRTADLIYASHVLEHFTHGEVPKVLGAWRDLLKEGGRLVIVVPNFDLFVDRYAFENRKVSFESLCGLFKRKFSKRWPDYKHRNLSDHLIADITGGKLFPESDCTLPDLHKCLFTPKSFRALAEKSGPWAVRRIDLYEEDPIPEVSRSSLHWSSMAFELTKR